MNNIKLHTVLLNIAGSRAYGLNTESSDLDIKGIVIPPKEYILGFAKRFEQLDDSKQIVERYPELLKLPGADKKIEGTLYNLKKFMELAAECNPNIIETLYINPDHIIQMSKYGAMLIENREMFLSAKAKFTFTGYAISQLKRIEGHRRFFKDPPKKIPERSDFGLSIKPFIRKEEFDSVLYISKDNENFCENSGFVDLIRREKEYKRAVDEYKHYETWKENRNKDRFDLELKYGYDCKHASHLIRLLRMGVEILTTGKVNVDRKEFGDSEDIMRIRNGLWGYERLLQYANDLSNQIDCVYENKQYVVRHSVDKESIDKLYINIIEKFLHDN